MVSVLPTLGTRIEKNDKATLKKIAVQPLQYKNSRTLNRSVKESVSGWNLLSIPDVTIIGGRLWTLASHRLKINKGYNLYCFYYWLLLMTTWYRANFLNFDYVRFIDLFLQFVCYLLIVRCFVTLCIISLFIRFHVILMLISW